MTFATPAVDDERLATIEHRIADYGRAETIAEAARLRGVDVPSMVKTMVVRRGEGDYLFVLVPGDKVIDWAKLRSVLGQRRLTMADADEAHTATGYRRGSITPFGATTRWPVVVDSPITGRNIAMGSGVHGVSITASGADVAAALDATVADVTKPAG